MFDISLRDLLRMRRAGRIDIDERRQGPMSYFEDEEFIHLYLPEQYVIYHTVFKKGGTFFDEEGTELAEESFRLAVLAGAIELMAMPKELRIKIEQ